MIAAKVAADPPIMSALLRPVKLLDVLIVVLTVLPFALGSIVTGKLSVMGVPYCFPVSRPFDDK